MLDYLSAIYISATYLHGFYMCLSISVFIHLIQSAKGRTGAYVSLFDTQYHFYIWYCNDDEQESKLDVAGR